MIPTGQTCVTFWYHMYGPDIATLTINSTMNGQDTMIWQRSGSQGDKWLQGNLQLNSNINFQVRYFIYPQ